MLSGLLPYCLENSVPYDPMNQVHPGPTEPVDRVPTDATQARTGNTQAEQNVWFAGIEEGQRRAEHNAAVRSAWTPIESAPRTGCTLLLGYANSHGKWRTVRGQWMSDEYIGNNWEEPDDIEAGWFETAVEADDVPNCWHIEPTHWQPLPAAPCQTCNDQGAVGNILTAEPCPDCTPPASAQDDAKDEHSDTYGMNLGERIAHVGGRTNAQGYTEFGSPMAVNALIQHVLRDIDWTRQDDDGAYQARYRLPGGQWSSWGHVVCGVKGHEQELRYLPGARRPAPTAGDARDAERYRWLTEDHADPGVRKHRNDILRRMSVMSHSAASADIDAAIAAQQHKGDE
ncbi:PF04448 family protein [Bordetella bronchiseptica F4563]|uniref:DUF551 domain-containing protein n=1 Tax=Bordetella bronchiseptica TaxID=518 RepID=UPI000461A3B2|nr:DUF551 domain-containing protein [Bordetella bronchiseptica]KDC23984.1 PF04448 family protein [Bordetella bronchiseptica F4563]